ncbi:MULTISPECIES: hypothetical protein [Salimicrobium]|uniref:Uncharacterized protein n=4 Tax=Salimicrobium TaxID=351195 RepID=K2GQ72_9BACI|nr:MULTISPECIES: hypothetical protein [Salimicrobium]AKG05105.1 hypothetical protein AAV35_010120 [Salimicrobium jeotgali]EKE32529.1 hypothetical protein MJ3_03812 [Salimicrobium jeotgali]MBM7695488.1 hypothetical protein [Salimicrobium jeotgali]PBB04964.1 hypothetical protein CKW00_11510 [Salimicrobium humidisoli]SDY15638.1 hypothetical protein SAMN04488081_2241 [Salimicrobium album]
MNRYKLARFQQEFAVLVQEREETDELLVLRERLEAFAVPGEFLYIDFDEVGNLKTVEVERDEEPTP